MFIHFSRKCPFIFVPNTNCHAMVPFVRQFSFWIYTFWMAWRLNERVREKKLDLITKVHRTMEIFIMERVFISTMDFIFLSNKCWHFFDIFLIAEHEMVFDESSLNVQFNEQLPMAQQKWIKCYSGFFFCILFLFLSFSHFLHNECTACPSLNARKT